jgi:hypothetical protein
MLNSNMDFNTQGGWDTTSHKFIPKIAGYYHICYNWRIADNNANFIGYAVYQVRSSVSTLITYGILSPDAANRRSTSFSGTFYFNAYDEFVINSNSNVSVQIDYYYISCHLVSLD